MVLKRLQAHATIDPDEIMRLVHEEEMNVVTDVEQSSDDGANSELDSNVDDYHVEPEENIDDDSNGFSETGGTF